MHINSSFDAAGTGAGNAFRQALRWFDRSPACLALLTGGDYQCVHANAACARLAGSSQLLGRPLFETFPELEEQGVRFLLDRTALRKRPYLGRGRWVGLNKGGELEWHWIDVILEPVFDAGGASLGLLLQCCAAGKAQPRSLRDDMVSQSLRLRQGSVSR